MKEFKSFFVPCTKQEESEVVKLLQQLGYKQWEDECAMNRYDVNNGLKADKGGDYWVTEPNSRDTIVTNEELREMVKAKQRTEGVINVNTFHIDTNKFLRMATEGLEYTVNVSGDTSEISYHVIKELGFTEEKGRDGVHEREYGYPYKIFYLNLTKRISLDWNQVTRRARILRTDKEGYIKNERPITSELMLREIVSFFMEDKQ